MVLGSWLRDDIEQFTFGILAAWWNPVEIGGREMRYKGGRCVFAGHPLYLRYTC